MYLNKAVDCDEKEGTITFRIVTVFFFFFFKSGRIIIKKERKEGKKKGNTNEG